MPDQKVTGKDYMRTRAGRARKVNGQDGQGQQGQGQDEHGRSRAGWIRMGKDMLRAGWQGQFMGRMDKGLDRLDMKKLDINSSGLSPGLDCPDDKWHSTV